MTKTLSAVSLVLSFLLPATTIAATPSASVDAFAKGALLGMQLSAKQGVKQGKLTGAQAGCVQALPSSAFQGVVEKLMASAFDSKDLALADRFYASATGRKYTKYGMIQLYSAAGERAPEPLPVFSDAEHRELEAFAATPVGKRLIREQAMASPAVKSALIGRIQELIKQCQAR